MKKILFLTLFLFILVGCGEKKNQITCSGSNTDSYGAATRFSVTINYDDEDKITSLDYNITYYNEEAFKKGCEEVSMKNPTCENLVIKYKEEGEVVSIFKKDDVVSMLKEIGIDECE